MTSQGIKLLKAACEEHGKTIETQEKMIDELRKENEELRASLRAAIDHLEPAVRSIQITHELLERQTADPP